MDRDMDWAISRLKDMRGMFSTAKAKYLGDAPARMFAMAANQLLFVIDALKVERDRLNGEGEEPEQVPQPKKRGRPRKDAS